MAAQSYADHLSLLDARAMFFERSGLPADGGYSSRWVRVETKPFPVYFPNWSGRVAAARQHDLHHIAAEYATDWSGEAEIAAWEIASSCRRYFAAWLLDLAGMTAGLVIAPRRMFRAFIRGRRARTNLYALPISDGELAHRTVGELRSRLGVGTNSLRANGSDLALFVFWSAVAVILIDLLPIAALAVVAWALR